MSIIYVNQAAAVGGDGKAWVRAYQQLSSALAIAQSGDEIWLAQGTYTPGSTPQATFEIRNSVSIYGGFTGAELNRADRDWQNNLTILSGSLGSAGHSHHVVTGNSTANAGLDGVIIEGGNTTGAANEDGGGVYNRAGRKLSLENVIVRNNRAADDGGGIRNDGVLSVVNSAIANNQSVGSSQTSGGGGLINTANASATILNSTFSHNQARNGGGIRNDGTLRLINATLSRNTGGGLVNTTSNPFSASAPAANAEIRNSTITQNTGAGIINFGRLNAANSIVAGNNDGNNDLIDAPFAISVSGGNNFIGDRGDTTAFADGANNDQVGSALTGRLDPLLGALQNNGGFTQTHVPKETSPVIDAGNNQAVAIDESDLDDDDDSTEQLPFDQRGIGFERINSSVVDIGAVEYSSDISNNPEQPTDVDDKPALVIKLSAIAPPLQNKIFADNTINSLISLSVASVKNGPKSTQVEPILSIAVDKSGKIYGLSLPDGTQSSVKKYSQTLTDWAQTLFSALQFTASPKDELDQLLVSRLLASFSDGIPDILSIKESSLNDLQRSYLSSLYKLFGEGVFTREAAALEQLDARNLQISFNTSSNNSLFDRVVLAAALGDAASPLGVNLQQVAQAESELIDLRNVAGTVNATFEVYREADFNNEVGFFKIEDITGQVLDAQGNLLGVGDEGYIRAAMQQQVALSLTSTNNRTSIYSAVVAGGQLLSSFIVSNGSVAELLDSDTSNDPAVYFTHIGANSDRFDHIRSIGDNMFAFEDTTNGGDQDFNDLIVKASFV
ncbi:MAG: DUF4114 domain-containing protein [Phormidesmis sp.]